MAETIRWWKRPQSEVAHAISEEINAIESTQLDLYENYYYLAYLYDPYDYVARTFFTYDFEESQVTENLCCSNVDTVTSVAARQTVRPVFLTDEGDWTVKRLASDLARYSEGIAKLVRLDECKPRMFKDAAIFGYGVRHFEMDEDGEITHDRFLPIEVRVSEAECLTQGPRQMHLLKFRDRDELCARFPDKASELETTPKEMTGSFFGLGGLNVADQIMLRYSYRLPVGRKGKRGYLPGRKVISTREIVLVDEEWEYDRFPVAIIRWTERSTGFAGSGLVENLQTIQRTVNKMHNAFDQQVDLHASPVTFVNVNDVGAAKKLETSAIGRTVPVLDSESVKFLQPPVIAPEAERRLERLSELSRTNSGISDMHAHGTMPARLETGAAVRESNDVASERFAIQEKALERWYLDCIEVILLLCKCNADKGLKTPDIGYSFLHVKKRIKWSQVDLKDVTYQLQAAPQLSRTLAGRMDTIAQWQNSGMITPEQARHLIHHPDLDDAMGQIDSYLEYLDHVCELLLHGDYIPPDPRGDLMQIGLGTMTARYFQAINDGAPEDRIENMRTYLDQMAFLIAKATPPAPAPAPGPAPGAAPPQGMPPQQMSMAA